MIEIVLLGRPVPWSAPFVSRHGAFSKHMPMQRMMKHLIKEQYSGVPLEGPLVLDISFYFSIPKSFSKKKALLALEGKIPFISRPDCSNLVKMLEDAGTGVLWNDDRQIVEIRANKQYGPEEKTTLMVIQSF